ncbi:MAG: hypothetical protein R3A48_11720 [Polyangiales bacterium]
MSFLFVGPKGSFEVRWITYALLRDNVQHHVGDEPTPLNDVSAAMGTGRAELSAPAVNAAARAARDALVELPIDQLAVSERTLSVLSFKALPSSTGATVLASEIGGVPFVDPRAVTLRDVFGNLLTNLIEVTDGAVEGELVEVRDV